MTIPTDIRTQLATYTTTAFTYEDDFLSEFCKAEGAVELLQCYMGDNRTLINIKVPSGTIINTTISTTKFIIWCDEKNGLLATG